MRKMMRLAAAVCVLLAAGMARGAAIAPTTRAAEQLAIIDAVAPSLCRIELTFQFDKGEAPATVGWHDVCPTCGASHGSRSDGVIEQERPMELPGVVLTPTQVMSPDLHVHPRFIKKIAVRVGDQLIEAKTAGVFKGHHATLLELAQPIKDAKPMPFDEKAAGPYYMVKHQEVNARWTISVMPGSEGLTHRDESGRTYRTASLDTIVVNKAGVGVGVLLGEELPMDDSWKSSPLKWDMIKAAEMEKILADCEKRAADCVLRVSLSFRSPKVKAGAEMYEGGDDQSTEKNVLGVLVDERTIMVLAGYPRAATSRLQRIVVRPEGKKAVPATFMGSVEEYGCFFAKLESPLSGAMAAGGSDVFSLRKEVLLRADIMLQGEKRVAYFDHTRVRGYMLGWKRNTYMHVDGAGPVSFVFDADGKIVGLPVARRPKAGADGDREMRDSFLTPMAVLAPVLANPQKSFDRQNRPMSEEEENRIAWMGLELQPLTRELARANGVSELTFDGASGALITYVYPDSPAARAGMETGDILLRLHLPNQPRPVEVRAERYAFAEQPFPWDRLADCPEEYFDRLPQPWQPIEGQLTKVLTDLGFDKAYTVEFFHDGKTVKKQLAATACPTYYESASRYKDDRMGATVRDVTFEVRRYFQRKDDEPGVIVSRIEIGSTASKAGLRPFELITHVNDKPVKNVAEFKAAIEGAKDLRLEVKQLTKGRLVKVKLGAPTSGPSTRISRKGEE